MFGHRGLWQDGWKAVAFHPPGTPFDADRWELFHLDADFSETDDLAGREPERLPALIERVVAARPSVPGAAAGRPLRRRASPRTARYHGPRRQFVFHAGMGHLPTDVAPDVRGAHTTASRPTCG
jgi:arylsulfatase